MKKLMAVFLAAVMALSLVACGGDSQSSGGSGSSGAASNTASGE